MSDTKLKRFCKALKVKSNEAGQLDDKEKDNEFTLSKVGNLFFFSRCDVRG